MPEHLGGYALLRAKKHPEDEVGGFRPKVGAGEGGVAGSPQGAQRTPRGAHEEPQVQGRYLREKAVARVAAGPKGAATTFVVLG